MNSFIDILLFNVLYIQINKVLLKTPLYYFISHLIINKKQYTSTV